MMRAILWPHARIDPAYQVKVGETAGDKVPPFLRYGCSLAPRDIETPDPEDLAPVEITGRKTTRKARKAVAA